VAADRLLQAGTLMCCFNAVAVIAVSLLLRGDSVQNDCIYFCKHLPKRRQVGHQYQGGMQIDCECVAPSKPNMSLLGRRKECQAASSLSTGSTRRVRSVVTSTAYASA